MKIVYAGTPDFAVLPLKSIIENGYEVVGVITQADKPQGRKGILTPPPVKTFATEKNIPVLQPEKLKENVEALRALQGDILITCAYGQILTQEVLDCFKLGVWNIHAGLLPMYRGASPIQSCILNGESETGVSIMKTELGLDSGDVLLEERINIIETETSGELSSRLSALGAEMIIKALQMLESGTYILKPQGNEGVRVVRKINKEQAKVDFSKSVKEVICFIHGMNPAPIAYAFLNGSPVNMYRAERAILHAEERAYFENAKCGEVLSDSPKRGLLIKCHDGAVKVLEVQASGGKKIGGGDFLNGRKTKKGDIFCAE